VWTAADVLRGHGYREEAIALVNGYLDQRLERKEDAGSGFLPNNQARLLYAAERWDDARQMFQDNIDLDRVDDGQKAYSRLLIAYIDARQGDEESARRGVEEFLDNQDFVYNESTPYTIQASLEALVGEKEKAVLLLREAAAHGEVMGHHLIHDPELQSLIGYEPFDRLTQPRG